MDILIVKYLHILSSTLLFGTGLGSVFYKWQADRSGDLRAIRVTNRNVVLADWVFTTPTVILQPLSGFYLVNLNGYGLDVDWLMASIILFVIAGSCWLPVVYLQIKMAAISKQCVEQGKSLPDRYFRLNRLWFALGVPAFIAMMIIYALMVFKPNF